MNLKHLISSLEYHRCHHIDQLVTFPLKDLFKYYKGYWWVWPEQLQQIKNNKQIKTWKPSTQLYSEISFAGVLISREEAIENAIPYKEEYIDPDNIAVGYFWIDTPQIDQIRQTGSWQ